MITIEDKVIIFDYKKLFDYKVDKNKVNDFELLDCIYDSEKDTKYIWFKTLMVGFKDLNDNDFIENIKLLYDVFKKDLIPKQEIYLKNCDFVLCGIKILNLNPNDCVLFYKDDNLSDVEFKHDNITYKIVNISEIGDHNLINIYIILISAILYYKNKNNINFFGD